MANRPYQPLLLRLLHGANALFVVLALVTGYWVYNQFDGRWGRLRLPRLDGIIDLHGTIGLTFFLFVPFFALYSLTLGRRRLVQSRDLAQLGQPATPQWWIALHRLVNSVMLVASLLAWVSGKQMDETWLPQGQLHQPAYLFHLIAWAFMGVSLLLHLLMGVKVGGVPLLLSMVSPEVRSNDTPGHWLAQIKAWRDRKGN
ncbi:MAG: cytochrome b/b6 domain-containing protein [Synechococcales bacterium]|nr:cytochrome b/b6 domain-containing protein [Synechococcales bacterium]